MTDIAAMTRKLQALAANDAVFVGDARVISRNGFPAPVTALLDEIDIHVLERNLIFDVDGTVLECVVGGRRLRGIATGASVPEGLRGKVLSLDDPETLAQIGATLRKICDNAGQITVRSTAATAFGTPADLGVTASALARIWQAVDDEPRQSPMAQFLSACPTGVTDFLHIVADDITASKGDVALLDLIWHDQAKALCDKQKSLFPRQAAATLICLDTGGDQHRAPAVAMIGTETAVFLYRPTQITGVLAAWQKTLQ